MNSTVPIDPENLRLAQPFPAKSVPSQRPPRHRLGERFIAGPLPLAWLSEAGRLPGKVLHVALALFFRAGIEKRRTIQLSHSDMKLFGVSRNATHRALRALEETGLVIVKCPPGRCPTVTLLEWPRSGQ